MSKNNIPNQLFVEFKNSERSDFYENASQVLLKPLRVTHTYLSCDVTKMTKESIGKTVILSTITRFVAGFFAYLLALPFTGLGILLCKLSTTHQNKYKKLQKVFEETKEVTRPITPSLPSPPLLNPTLIQTTRKQEMVDLSQEKSSALAIGYSKVNEADIEAIFKDNLIVKRIKLPKMSDQDFAHAKTPKLDLLRLILKHTTPPVDLCIESELPLSYFSRLTLDENVKLSKMSGVETSSQQSIPGLHCGLILGQYLKDNAKRRPTELEDINNKLVAGFKQMEPEVLQHHIGIIGEKIAETTKAIVQSIPVAKLIEAITKKISSYDGSTNAWGPTLNILQMIPSNTPEAQEFIKGFVSIADKMPWKCCETILEDTNAFKPFLLALQTDDQIKQFVEKTFHLPAEKILALKQLIDHVSFNGSMNKDLKKKWMSHLLTHQHNHVYFSEMIPEDIVLWSDKMTPNDLKAFFEQQFQLLFQGGSPIGKKEEKIIKNLSVILENFKDENFDTLFFLILAKKNKEVQNCFVKSLSVEKVLQFSKRCIAKESVNGWSTTLSISETYSQTHMNSHIGGLVKLIADIDPACDTTLKMIFDHQHSRGILIKILSFEQFKSLAKQIGASTNPDQVKKDFEAIYGDWKSNHKMTVMEKMECMSIGIEKTEPSILQSPKTYLEQVCSSKSVKDMWGGKSGKSWRSDFIAWLIWQIFKSKGDLDEKETTVGLALSLMLPGQEMDVAKKINCFCKKEDVSALMKGIFAGDVFDKFQDDVFEKFQLAFLQTLAKEKKYDDLKIAIKSIASTYALMSDTIDGLLAMNSQVIWQSVFKGISEYYNSAEGDQGNTVGIISAILTRKANCSYAYAKVLQEVLDQQGGSMRTLISQAIKMNEATKVSYY